MGRERFQVLLLSLQLQPIQGLQLKFYSVSTPNPVILCKETILHIELILLQEISKKYFNYKAHPMQADTRHPPATVPCASKHSTCQKPFPGSLQHTQASSNSTCRNSIPSSRQHPHTPYKILQGHFYRVLQGEIGFFPKGLSVANPCSTKVSVFQFTTLLVLRIILQEISRNLILPKIPKVLCEEISYYLSSK